MNSLGNGKIVTQKVNLARLTELAIHQSKDSKTGGDLYDTSPMAVTMSCLGKGSTAVLLAGSPLYYGDLLCSMTVQY